MKLFIWSNKHTLGISKESKLPTLPGYLSSSSFSLDSFNPSFSFFCVLGTDICRLFCLLNIVLTVFSFNNNLHFFSFCNKVCTNLFSSYYCNIHFYILYMKQCICILAMAQILLLICSLIKDSTNITET